MEKIIKSNFRILSEGYRVYPYLGVDELGTGEILYKANSLHKSTIDNIEFTDEPAWIKKEVHTNSKTKAFKIKEFVERTLGGDFTDDFFTKRAMKDYSPKKKLSIYISPEKEKSLNNFLEMELRPNELLNLAVFSRELAKL